MRAEAAPFAIEAGDGDGIAGELRSLLSLRAGGADHSGADEDLRRALAVTCVVLVGESARRYRIEPGAADALQSLSAYRKMRMNYPEILAALGRAALAGHSGLTVTIGQGAHEHRGHSPAHAALRAMPRILAMMRGQQFMPGD